MYTALVLTPESQHQLLSAMDPFLLSEYDEPIAHHMTINMGSCKDASILGKKFSMEVIAIAHDDKVLAVKIETGCPSQRPLKHITVAVNRKNGGKPVMSNDLTNWEPSSNLTLSGVVEECL